MKKETVPASSAEFGPWTAARFHTQEARDHFLVAFAALRTDEVEAVGMPGEGRGALVRWRPGKFLRLNDVAHGHGGRIVLPATRRRAG